MSMASATLLEQETEAPEAEEAGGRSRYDAELKRIAAVIRLLEEGDEPSRSRIMAYLSDRYNGRES
jgi:hypothetical protein